MNQRAAKITSSLDTSDMSLQAQSQLERLEAANAQLEVRLLVAVCSQACAPEWPCVYSRTVA